MLEHVLVSELLFGWVGRHTVASVQVQRRAETSDGLSDGPSSLPFLLLVLHAGHVMCFDYVPGLPCAPISWFVLGLRGQ